MKCDEIQGMMPDLASGGVEANPEIGQHLVSCQECAGKLEEFRKTMALLDEWQAPEPSQYFDVRLQARLREEMSKPQAGWLAWLRRPVLAASMTVLLGVGLGLFFTENGRIYNHGREQVATVEPQISLSNDPGTAVGDLQALDKNHDLYADFDLLDDLEVQHDVTANP